MWCLSVTILIWVILWYFFTMWWNPWGLAQYVIDFIFKLCRQSYFRIDLLRYAERKEKHRQRESERNYRKSPFAKKYIECPSSDTNRQCMWKYGTHMGIMKMNKLCFYKCVSIESFDIQRCIWRCVGFADCFSWFVFALLFSLSLALTLFFPSCFSFIFFCGLLSVSLFSFVFSFSSHFNLFLHFSLGVLFLPNSLLC